jgi:hypothetical protein
MDVASRKRKVEMPDQATNHETDHDEAETETETTACMPPLAKHCWATLR